MDVQKEIEVALKRKFKKSSYAKIIVDPQSTVDEQVPELEEAEQLVRNELIDTVYDVAEDDEFDSG